jgi:two-component sensor histidine kinase
VTIGKSTEGITMQTVQYGSAGTLSFVLDEQLLEILPAAVYLVDLNGVVVRYNKRAAELWGRSPIPGDANEIYCGAHRLYKPNGEQLPHDQTPMADAMRMGVSFRNIEVQMEQPNGRRIWVLVSIDPLRDESGRIIGALNCFQDITEHKLAQERQMQIEELNHRVKNVIATVQSIAAYTFKNTDDAGPAKTFEGRLIALARAHDVLARENWDGANLHDIVREVAAPFCPERLEFNGPDVRIDPKFGVSLALAFQELGTNALKYGALSKPTGSIRLQWDVSGKEGSRRLSVDWIETTSFAVQQPTRKGFGTSLIERLLTRQHQADVRLSYPPEGARCEIVAPL